MTRAVCFFSILSIMPLEQLALGAGSASPSQCAGAPQDFRISSQGAVYACRKLSCDGQVPAEPVASPTPGPVLVQVVCDATFRLVVRGDGGFVLGGEFSSQDRCQRAVDQFRTHKGCLCSSNFVPMCYAQNGTKGARFEAMGSTYSRLDACLRALEQLREVVEVKPR